MEFFCTDSSAKNLKAIEYGIAIAWKKAKESNAEILLILPTLTSPNTTALNTFGSRISMELKNERNAMFNGVKIYLHSTSTIKTLLTSKVLLAIWVSSNFSNKLAMLEPETFIVVPYLEQNKTSWKNCEFATTATPNEA